MTIAPGGEGGGGAAIYADDAPPPLPEYDQPPIPAEGYVWTPGYWSWNGYEYFWVPGTWVEPPQNGLLWTPGYWAFVNGVYAFHRGYWGEHVGFYGGVDYGFGYRGVGYEGGRWENGRFFYNRAVVNLGHAKIADVYDQPIPEREANRENRRASFNGGPNGVDLKPTPAEVEAAKEKHLAPTKDQLHNARVAGRTESAFVSANKGKPEIAATAKPGVFKGEAVIHAKAAGGPMPAAGESTGAPTTTNGATPEPTKGETSRKPGEPTPEATKGETPKGEPTKGETPKAEPTKGETPKAEPTKPGPTPEPTKTRMENKVETPKAEPTKTGPTPEPSKTRLENKIEQPKSEPIKPTPEMKVERPKPEPSRTEPMKVDRQNQTEPRNGAAKGAAEGGKPAAGACGQLGERHCPK